MEWSWVVSPATMVALVGWLITVGVALWRRSGSEATAAAGLAACHDRIGALRKEFDEARAANAARWEAWRDQYEKGRDEFRRNIDVSVGSMSAAMTLLREQFGEMKTDVAREYVTKGELREVESRFAHSVSRIEAKVDGLADQMNKMTTDILTAVRTAQIRPPS